MNVVRFVLGLLVALALEGAAQAQQRNPSPRPGAAGARMYKCVDAAGKIYYSDKITHDCAREAEISRHGVVRDKREEGRPEQPGKPGKAAKPDEAAGAKKAEEQKRRDRALMATYTSEQEIDDARDRSLALPLEVVKTAERKLDQVNRELYGLKKQAEKQVAQKKAVPPHLLEDIDLKQKEVLATEAELARKKAQADSIRARYEADRLRYQELKSGGN